MIRYIILIIILIQSINLKAQKREIDFSAIEKWPSETTGQAAISDDGRYIMMSTIIKSDTEMVLQSNQGSWERSFLKASWLGFTKDSKRAIIQTTGDSLGTVTLGTDKTDWMSNVKKSLFISNRDGDFIACIINDAGKKSLKLVNLVSGAAYYFSGITDIIGFGDLVNSLLVATKDSNKGLLQVISLDNKKLMEIWKGEQASNYAFNKQGDQLAFSTPHLLWYYKTGMNKALLIAKEQLEGQDENLNIRSLRFSADNKRIFVSVQKKKPKAVDSSKAVKVDVWNYKESLLHSVQLLDNRRSFDSPYIGVISLEDTGVGKVQLIQRLQMEGDQLLSRPEQITGDYVVIAHRKGGDNEDWWNPSSMPEILLVSLKDGKRKIFKNPQPIYHQGSGLKFEITPNGKYVVYFDNLGGKKASLQWYSYEIATGITRCLTKKIRVPFNVQLNDGDQPDDKYYPYGYGIVGWVGKDQSVLLEDQYDIWQIDLKGNSSPINLTKSYGRFHKIKFDVVRDLVRFNFDVPLFNVYDTVLLSAYNIQNKQNGFFTIQLGKGSLKKLTIGPYRYTGLIKAKNASAWLVKRETASDATNWFLTSDWKNFTPLTNCQPQKEYNWLTSGLVTWKTFDGRPGQGMLFKPEDFDPKKKYPVIIQYYQQKSAHLYVFPAAGYASGEINIPYMVSKGYLVFVPDIHYKIGEPGKSAYNYIVSGAEFLKKKSYVDGDRMGLQGHSFGGWETDFVIAHSHLFAAAMSASGWADFIMDYNSILDLERGQSRQNEYEITRGRIGATLWQRPDLYIKNSPIFQADKVSTPILLMNNQKDDNIHFASGVEFFTALRRLQKPAWMLQYDGEGHMLSKKENTIDYTIRMTQFFDHYLKGTLAPKWMTVGVPASMKGIDDGLELDTSGKRP